MWACHQPQQVILCLCIARLTVSYPILSCSMASIFSARAITLFIISFSSSVRSGPGPGPGCMVQLPLSVNIFSSWAYTTSAIWLNDIRTHICIHTSHSVLVQTQHPQWMNEHAFTASTHYAALWTVTEQKHTVKIREAEWELIYLLLFFTSSQIAHQRDAGETKEGTVQRRCHHLGTVNKTEMFWPSFLPGMHVPLPVVGHPAIRAAAHHRVRHAALLQSAGGQEERKTWIQHEIVQQTLTDVIKRCQLWI